MLPLMMYLKIANRFVRQRSVLISVITLSFIALSSVGVNYFERGAADSNIRSIWDGVWWAVVTAVLFAALTAAVLGHLTVVQGIDDHIHSWVVANRSGCRPRAAACAI